MTTDTPIGKSANAHTSSPTDVSRRMIRLRPTKSLGDRFPAMHLVRSSWFARFLSRVTFILLVGLALAAIFLPWQQTSRCTGEVVAKSPQLRRQVVTSPVKGVVSELKADLREGSIVYKDEVIMVLKALAENQLEQTKEQERRLLAKIELAKSNLEISKAQVLSDTENLKRAIESTEAEVKAAEYKLAEANQKMEAQKGNYDQAVLDLEVSTRLRFDAEPDIMWKRAVTKEFMEQRKLSESEAAVNGAYQDLISKEKSLLSKMKENETKILELNAKVNKAQSEIDTIEKERQELLVKLGELDRLNIKSPSDGRIQAIQGQVGTPVKDGDKLFEVIPDTSDLAVELNVRGLDLQLIGVDDEVRLQFEGWPAIQFVGWPSVAVGTFGGRVIAINPSDDSKGNFKIFVGPDPNDPRQEKWPDSRYLRQGVKANGWVILKTVPLGFEIWRQLNGFPPTIDKSAPSEEKAKDPKMPKFK